MSAIAVFKSGKDADGNWIWYWVSGSSPHPGYTLKHASGTLYAMHKGDSKGPMVAQSAAWSASKGSVFLQPGITGSGEAARVEIEAIEGSSYQRFDFDMDGGRCEIATDSNDQLTIKSAVTGNTLAWADKDSWAVYENIGVKVIDRLAACLLAQGLIDHFFIPKTPSVQSVDTGLPAQVNQANQASYKPVPVYANQVYRPSPHAHTRHRFHAPTYEQASQTLGLFGDVVSLAGNVQQLDWNNS